MHAGCAAADAVDAVNATPVSDQRRQRKGEAQPSRRSVEERNTLVEANRGLTFYVLGKLRLRQHPLADDLESAGMVGLIRAADLFDETRGVTFSTYAYWSIRRAILREYQTTGSIIHIPQYLQGEERADLSRRLAVGALPGTVDGNDGDMLADRGEADPAAAVDREEARERIAAALNCLSGRWRDILIRRVVEGEQLSQIGEDHGITRERTRQIVKLAMQRVRRRQPDLATLLAG